jgi:hypothetical protein
MSIIVMNATLNKNILGRYKEIGILKSIGLKEKHIFMISVVFEERLKPFYDQFGFSSMLCGQMETYRNS